MRRSVRFGLPFVLIGAAAFAGPAQAALHAALTAASPPPGVLHLVASNSGVIDKSCLMMCDKWGEHDCLKWVTRCKGDPGYPKATGNAMQEHAPNTGSSGPSRTTGKKTTAP
jgi:hypothetical protein